VYSRMCCIDADGFRERLLKRWTDEDGTEKQNVGGMRNLNVGVIVVCMQDGCE
jgi:hypothetical protein